VGEEWRLSKTEVRRALVRHHFAPVDSLEEVFDRVRSVQIDPLAPCGSNHDLAIQARLAGYRVGDWQKAAYEDKYLHDGWDKMASLVPWSGWWWRRVFYRWNTRYYDYVSAKHPEALHAVMAELQARGPLASKDFDYQERKPEWKGSWDGTSVTKMALKALWATGQIMTCRRVAGQHVYDLAERVVPPGLEPGPVPDDETAVRELVMERHRAAGVLRPQAPPEVWSYRVNAKKRKQAILELVEDGELTPVDLAGTTAYITNEFAEHLDSPPVDPRVVFVAPLDAFMWDRKLVAHIFDFEYSWEVFVPEAKRRWGYYVLPVVYGDRIVARVEFWARNGVLEVRKWIWEPGDPGPRFNHALEAATREFMAYCSAERVAVADGIDPVVADLMKSLRR